MVELQEGERLACISPFLLIPRDFLEQVEEEDPRGTGLTQVHLEKWPLNGSSSCIFEDPAQRELTLN